MNVQFSARAVALLLATGAVVGVACSSTNTNPTPDGGGGSSIVTGSSSSSTSTSSSSSSGTGGATTSSSSGSTSTSSTGGATCYDGGAPMTNNDFLNPCEPSATCQTFPNSTLPGLTADGGLPALP